ncbi:MAG TPA: VWA domain-containing protein, partial [Desulfuromonadales bacterium]|nr:VWA domain-containing protein [Desulfuromonadales bacterium]
MNLSAFHFLRPYALLALPPVGLLLFLLARRRGRHNPWRSVCDPQLLPHILSGSISGRHRPAWFAAALGALLGILALAGPTWQRLPQPAYLNQSGLVIVLDLNASMNAADLEPSRLARARYKIADILRSRHEGETGLVVYSGDAFTVTPMTDDTNTIYSQLSVLNPGLMPSRGNRADLGLARAASLLKQAGLRHGEILLVADG